MVGGSTPPFNDDLPPLEVDFAAELFTGPDLAGFLAVRRTTVVYGRARRAHSREMLRWRVALDPSEPWDEGYQDLEDAKMELSEGRFLYAGNIYVVRWAKADLAHWILELILAN